MAVLLLELLDAAAMGGVARLACAVPAGLTPSVLWLLLLLLLLLQVRQ
jgi:hypothetical protein